MHRARFPGAHRRTGMVALGGPGVVRGARLEGPRVRDVGLTLLAAAGVVIPDDRDGRVWQEALQAKAKKAPGKGSVAAVGPGPTAEEQAAMDDALRGLGYL